MPFKTTNQDSKELLSICIPTFNRARYLRDLLLTLERQIQENDISDKYVRILVSDNASSDTTLAVVQEVAGRLPHLTYFRQEQNVGFIRNVISCVAKAKGKFCWVCGDDELLQPGGVKALVAQLESDPPLALLVSLSAHYVCALHRPVRFDNYRAYALACAVSQPHILVEHTLISSNIFRTELFDCAIANKLKDTPFGHMFALLNPIIEDGGPVALPAFPLIEVREQRPPFTEWPENLEQSWIEYLEWQKQKLDLNELHPEQAIEQVRQELLCKITRHPLRYIRNNLGAVLKPQAWNFILKRLWGHRRRSPRSSAAIRRKS